MLNLLLKEMQEEEKHRLRSVFFRHGITETPWQLETCLREVLGSRYCVTSREVATMHDFRRDGPVTPGGFEAIVARIHASQSDRTVTDEAEVLHTFTALGGGETKDGAVMVGRLRKLCMSNNLSVSLDALIHEMDSAGSGKLEYGKVRAHLLNSEDMVHRPATPLDEAPSDGWSSPLTGVESSPKSPVGSMHCHVTVQSLQSKLARISREHAAAVSDRGMRLRRFGKALAQESRRDTVAYEFVGPLGGAPTPVQRKRETPLFVRGGRSEKNTLRRERNPQKKVPPPAETPRRSDAAATRITHSRRPWTPTGRMPARTNMSPPTPCIVSSLAQKTMGELSEGARKFREHLQWRVENNCPYMA